MVEFENIRPHSDRSEELSQEDSSKPADYLLLDE